MSLKSAIVVAACLVIGMAAWSFADCKKSNATIQSFRPDQLVVPYPAMDSKDTCTYYRHWPEDTVLGYYSGYTYLEQTVMYVDPAGCGTPTYPFEISGFSFWLFDPPNAYDPRTYKWPVQLDVVVYGVQLPPDSCSGPWPELCRIPLVCDSATYAYPNLATVSFPTPCCVDGPFYIGIEYTEPDTSKPYPSVIFDVSSVPDLCEVFEFYCEEWWGWHAFWVPGSMPGYPFFYVHGETLSENCCYDPDFDEICYGDDNCPNEFNPLQEDFDGDGLGDICDACPEAPNPGQEDTDGDGIADACDNCPGDFNASQADADGDGLGDVCDPCPLDSYNDYDSDGICGDVDNCPFTSNPGQEDADQNGVGDVCEIQAGCIGLRGNINGIVGDDLDITDLIFLVQYMFGDGPPPPIPEEADIDASGTLDIADLVYLVTYMFQQGPPPEPCP